MFINREKGDALSDIDNNDPGAHTINAVQILNDLAKLDNVMDFIAVFSKYDICVACIKLFLVPHQHLTQSSAE